MRKLIILFTIFVTMMFISTSVAKPVGEKTSINIAKTETKVIEKEYKEILEKIKNEGIPDDLIDLLKHNVAEKINSDYYPLMPPFTIFLIWLLSNIHIILPIIGIIVIIIILYLIL